ncbi:MAG: PLP-dependent transferase [Labedaea sp.]
MTASRCACSAPTPAHRWSTWSGRTGTSPTATAAPTSPASAGFLAAHKLASRVTYPDLPASPYRRLVEKYLPRGAGAVFSFDVAGGRAGGQALIRGVTLWSHLANVGDAKSLIIHPASTTHRQLSDEELRAAGVGPGTVRLSVGTESAADLIWDLEQAFAHVAATVDVSVREEVTA